MSPPLDLTPGSLAGVAPQSAGDPAYPAPWTTTSPREGLRDTDQARIVSLAPDVCLTPRGSALVPVPYNIHDLVGHDTAFANSVFLTRQRAMVLRSKTSHVHGNEQGTGGGVKSGTTPGMCEAITHASQLNIEGSPAIRHQDRFWMNNRNTIGEARFVRDTRAYPAPGDTDPVPGSARAGEGRSDPGVVSDAAPAPPAMRPGERYAFLDTRSPQETRSPPTQLPRPAPPTRPTPAPPADLPPDRAPPPADTMDPRGPSLWPFVRQILRRGHWGELLIPDNGYNLSDVVPRDDEERAIVERYRGRLSHEQRQRALREIEEHRRRQETATPLPEPSPQPAPLPQSRDGARVDQDKAERKRPCIVGTYDEIVGKCGDQGQAHHIVPDYTLRYGNRTEGMAGRNRIPNMPSFGGGPAICLQGNARVPGTEHSDAHLGDRVIEQLGVGANPANTARIEDIRRAATQATVAARPDCEAQIRSEVEKGFRGVNPDQLGRTDQHSLPTGDTRDALARGDRRGGAIRR